MASSHQPRRGIYRDESKVSIRLRLGCSVLPFPVRLVCPILLFNRRGWVWALQPPCAVDRLPCGRSINHYLISTYLPIFQSSLCLAAGCLGWGRPRGVAYSAAALCGSPGCNDTIMKPQSHRTVAFMVLPGSVTRLYPTAAAMVCVRAWHTPTAPWGCQRV